MAVDEYRIEFNNSELIVVPGFEFTGLDEIDQILEAGLSIVCASKHKEIPRVSFDSSDWMIEDSSDSPDSLHSLRLMLETQAEVLTYTGEGDSIVAKPNKLTELWDMLLEVHMWEPSVGTYITYDSTQEKVFIQFQESPAYVLKYEEKDNTAYWTEDLEHSAGPKAYFDAKESYKATKLRYIEIMKILREKLRDEELSKAKAEALNRKLDSLEAEMRRRELFVERQDDER